MVQYAVAEPRYVRRSRIDDASVKPVVEWQPSPHFPLFATNIAAKRAYIVNLEPERATHSDELIRMEFRARSQNLGHVKILRVRS